METSLEDHFANFYRFENGRVIDARSGKEILPDKYHSFLLQDTKGKRKRLSQKKLYKALYGKVFCQDCIEDLPNEEWRPIPDSEGKYLISSCGRVKSLNGYKASLLRPMIQKGYQRVDLRLTSGRRVVFVHRLVAEAFLPFPERLDMQLHHKDFRQDNNAAANLEWLLPSEHKKKHTERQQKEAKENEREKRA